MKARAAVEVVERGLIFSGPMACALWAGKKSVTRRLVKDLRVQLPREVRSDFSDLFPRDSIVAQPGVWPAQMHGGGAITINVDGKKLGVKPGEFKILSRHVTGETQLATLAPNVRAWVIYPRGAQRVWVREAWCMADNDPIPHVGYFADRTIVFHKRGLTRTPRAVPPLTWEDVARRSPLLMPRWASRMVRDLVTVRLEHLQDITDDDIVLEGVERGEHETLRQAFQTGWDALHGKHAGRTWADNPPVWRIELKPAKGRGP